MKRFVVLFLAVLLCLTVTACDTSPAIEYERKPLTTEAPYNKETIDPDLVDLWQKDDGTCWLFHNDGTVRMGSYSGTWNVTGVKLNMMFGDSTISGVYSIYGDRLTFMNDLGEVTMLTRVVSSTTTTTTSYYTSTQNHSSYLSAGALVGYWNSSSDGSMVLNADGTAKLGSDAATWSFSGNTLTVTLTNYGNSISVVCSLSGNTLTLFDNQGSVVAVYNKVG